MARNSKVNVLIEVDTKKGTVSVNNLEKNVKNLGTSSQKTGSVAGSAFKNISGAVYGAAAAFGAVTVAAGTAFHELLKAAKTQDEIAKLSKRFGESVETLSAFRLATKLTGTSMESLATALRRSAANALDAARGTGEAKESFDLLNISVTGASGKLKSGSEILLEVADRFKTMDDATLKAALAQDIFGRSGAELIPLLDEGSAGIQKMIDRAGELGMVFDAEAAAKAEAFNDSLTELSGAVEGLSFALGESLFPELKKVVDQVTRLTAGVDKGTLSYLSLAVGIASATAEGNDLYSAIKIALKNQADAINELNQAKAEAKGKDEDSNSNLAEEIERRRRAAEAAKSQAKALKELADAATAARLAEVYGTIPTPAGSMAGPSVPGINSSAMAELARLQREEILGRDRFGGFGDVSGVTPLPGGVGLGLPGIVGPSLGDLGDPDRLSSLQEFESGLSGLLGNLTDKIGLYQTALEGAGDAFAAWISGQVSGAQALKMVVAQSLGTLAREAAVRAIIHTAQGVAALTPWGAAQYGPAAAQFQSAALWGAAAAGAGGAARAITGGGGSGGSLVSPVGGGFYSVEPSSFELGSVSMDSGSGESGGGALTRAVEMLSNKIDSMPPEAVLTKAVRRRPGLVSKVAFGESPA